MEKDNRHLYEGMFVLSPSMGDEFRRGIMEKVSNLIAEHKGAIVKSHDMGRRRLAYEIDKQKEGWYWLVYFEMEPAMIASLWREFRLTEGILRFMTLRASRVLEKLEFKQLVEQ